MYVSKQEEISVPSFIVLQICHIYHLLHQDFSLIKRASKTKVEIIGHQNEFEYLQLIIPYFSQGIQSTASSILSLPIISKTQDVNHTYLIKQRIQLNQWNDIVIINITYSTSLQNEKYIFLLGILLTAVGRDTTCFLIAFPPPRALSTAQFVPCLPSYLVWTPKSANRLQQHGRWSSILDAAQHTATSGQYVLTASAYVIQGLIVNRLCRGTKCSVQAVKPSWQRLVLIFLISSVSYSKLPNKKISDLKKIITKVLK